MTAKNKARGNRFERYVVKLAHGMGKSAKRAWGSDGRSLGMHSEVDVMIDGKAYQCKKRRKLASYIKPSKNVHGQIIMEDRGEVFVVLRLKEYLRE
jgi:Holliday junction resolvase